MVTNLALRLLFFLAAFRFMNPRRSVAESAETTARQSQDYVNLAKEFARTSGQVKHFLGSTPTMSSPHSISLTSTKREGQQCFVVAFVRGDRGDGELHVRLQGKQGRKEMLRRWDCDGAIFLSVVESRRS